MRKLWIAALLLAGSTPLFAGGGGKLPFIHDVEKGMQKAKLSGTPILFYFTADW